ncbi:protein sidekick homolog, partial [Mercenaria mercenaria]|uniref:protein sidekick homolog n=1 Tax=Mercenaria mercenaria TaxID=6596 RepID=UPI00234E98A6
MEALQGSSSFSEQYLDQSCTATSQCWFANGDCRTSTCLCKTGYHQTGTASTGTCTKRQLGQTCTALGQCSAGNAVCSGTCQCQSGYYDTNGSGTGGSCNAKKGLGKPCTENLNECADSAAQCLDGNCTCGDNYYDSNGFTEGGNCVSVSELKVLAINFPSASVGTSGFRVSWTPPSTDKASQISSYIVYWRVKTGDNSQDGGSKVVLRTATTALVNTGVTSGKTYIVTVTSVNIWTQSGRSRTTSLANEQAAKPNIPMSLTTPDLNAQDGVIRIGWSAPASGVASGYRIQLLDGSNEITSKERPSSPVSLSNSTIKNGYRYNITIIAKSEAYNGTNYVWSDLYVEQIKTVVQVPSAPRSVQCNTIKDESITLTWMDPVFPNGDLVKYIIQVLNLNEQLLFNTSTDQVVESHTVISLSPGTTYRFRVFTENEKYTSINYGQSAFCMTKAK